jgi:hypothetical protein
MRESTPLAAIHDVVLEHLRGRTDVVLFGSQAVNAYVDDARMTQDVDILATDAARLAEELKNMLFERFHLSISIRMIDEGIAYRVYQIGEPKNRHLVDVRKVDRLPSYRIIDGVQVIDSEELLCQKVVGMIRRLKTAKGPTDLTDIRRLLLAFPELKTSGGAVAARLAAIHASADVVVAWNEIVEQEILPEDDDY